MQKLHIKFALNHLTCHQKADAWGESEPYMWNVFFKIDGSGVKLNSEFKLEGKPSYHFSAGSHGNLRAEGIGVGSRLGIPKEVGEWKTTLVPIQVPYFEGAISGLIGVVCILMEQNYVSQKGVEAGYQALKDYIQNAIDAAIVGFDPRYVDIHNIDGSIKDYFDVQVRQFKDKIGNTVGLAVANAQSLIQNVLTLVRRDVLVGYRVWDFSSAGIEAEGGDIAYRQRWETKKYGDWEVSGRLSANYDPEENNAIPGEE